MLTNESRVKSATEVAVFVEQLTREAGARPYPDRRSEPRFAVDLPAEVHALNEVLEPENPPFEARVRDISASGLRLVHSDAVKNKFLAVVVQRKNGENMALLLKVLWCRRCGDHYELGGIFVTS